MPALMEPKTLFRLRRNLGWSTSTADPQGAVERHNMSGPLIEARDGDTIMYLGRQESEGWDVVLHLRSNRAVAGIRLESGISAGFYTAV